MKLIGNLQKGLAFIISAPAGTGKTTLVNMLSKEFSTVIRSISYTTRKPRNDEINGKDYHFISVEEFKTMVKQKEFLEWAEVFGDFYGTSSEQIEKKRQKGCHVILVIDTQGAKRLRKKLDFCSIFLFPPNMHELRYRLHSRKSESEEMIQMRLNWAKMEIMEAKYYDYHIINDDINMAYQVLRAIFIAQEHVTRDKKIPFINSIIEG